MLGWAPKHTLAADLKVYGENSDPDPNMTLTLTLTLILAPALTPFLALALTPNFKVYGEKYLELGLDKKEFAGDGL